MGTGKDKKVALFATCLVDLWRPSVGFATKSLLEKAGFQVDVPGDQTCCGQPNWNNGDRKGVTKLAHHTINLLKPYDYVVVPSGSCADMIKNHYPVLLKDDPVWQEKAEFLAAKTYELTRFLVEVAKYKPEKSDGEAQLLAYQDSCSCRRGLGIKDEPRALLKAQGAYQVKDMPGEEICCGFGGLFAARYGEVSSHMAGKKITNVKTTKAKVLTGADLGCLLNLEGKLDADGEEISVYHIAELLNGDGP